MRARFLIGLAAAMLVVLAASPAGADERPPGGGGGAYVDGEGDPTATAGDGTSGRTLPWLLRSAGVAEVRAKVHVRAVEVGDRRRTHRLGILDVAKARILAAGRLGEAEFDAHRAALAEHLADPGTLLIDQLFVQAWGAKPR